MATKRELNEAAKAVISETQENKRAETQAYWDETGTACDILDAWRSSQPKRVTLEYSDEEIPEHPALTYMHSKQYVIRSHALTLAEGILVGIFGTMSAVMLVAYTVLLH